MERIHKINLQLTPSLVKVEGDSKLGRAKTPQDDWQPDEQLAGFIQRIQVGPGDNRTGWPSPTHCSHHLKGLLLHHRSRRNQPREKNEENT